jgi:hypothetical protein
LLDILLNSAKFRCVVRRIAALGAVLSVACLAAATSVALADSSPPSARPFAPFVACMKEHKSSGPISATSLTEWKNAFDACRDLLPKGLLPKRPAGHHSDRPGHRFTLPTAAQVAAFKACMADKGFSRGTLGSSSRPAFRDPSVRAALKAALKACLPQLKPAATG